MEVNMETALCRYLRTHHTGRRNAASSKTLEAVFHVKGAEIRKTVNALRCGGFPVCSDTAGYYYAAKRQQRHHGGRRDAQARAAQAGVPLSILPPE